MNLQDLYPVEIKISFDQLSRALAHLRRKYSSIDIPPLSLASLHSSCTGLFYTRDDKELDVSLQKLDRTLFRKGNGLAASFFTALCQEMLSDLRKNPQPLTHD